MIDVLVVGSGASGVNAAAPLVEAGLRVTMIDFGNVDRQYAPLIPAEPFSRIRREDRRQHRYFLGDAFEGIPFGPVKVGAQLTPPRAFIAADTAGLMPIVSDGFTATESLALGGLAAGWGAGVFLFDDEDLASTPLTREELKPHFETVARRIGVSGAQDDLLPFLGSDLPLLPALELDTNARLILAAYERRRARLNRRGFYLGRGYLAACSVPFRGRGPHPYHDMDFWCDTNRSVYRPRWTVEELRRQSNFTYLDRRFVLSFREEDGVVEVATRIEGRGPSESHRARALVLASGTLSTARIVLRSLGRYDAPIPLVSNPYTYVPVVNLHMFGRDPEDRRHSLAQLIATFRDPRSPTGAVSVSVYSYRSLLTFKLLKEIRLPYREGLRILRLLIPCLNILGIHHPDRPERGKYCVLRQGSGGGPDPLEIRYSPSDEDQRLQVKTETRVLRQFRRLGCWPVARVRPGHGSSIHYAGTLPMKNAGGDLTTDRSGRLAGSRSVFVADGSVFASLPAKGLTFTMMANANRVGTLLARALA